MAYQLELDKYFVKKYQKLTNNNPQIKKTAERTIINLSQDPRNPSLGSHKVNSPKFGECVSSRVTGDIRIIWRYKDKNKLEIEILELIDIGGHNEVY